MDNNISLEYFEQIYITTYQKVLKYVICRCSNMEDVNDIIQDVYTEFYKHLQKKRAIENSEAYLIGIANHKLKKYYFSLKKIPAISLFKKVNENSTLLDTIQISDDINEIVFSKIEIEEIWQFLKQKGTLILKVFSLYYQFNLTIKEIAQELKLTESNVKNILYRTQKELKQKLERKDV